MMKDKAIEQTKKAIGYVRVSREEQVRNGVSLDAQVERIKDYAKFAGLELVDIFHEQGISGAIALSDRPCGALLIEVLNRKKVNNIIALKLDRLFRDALDAERTTREWKHKGVVLHLVDMGGSSFTSDSPVGNFFLSVMASVAELERGLIKERIRAAMNHKKNHYEVYSRKTPYGFRREGKHLIEIPEEIEVLKKIFKWRSSGDTFGDIAARLEKSNIKTKEGGRWHGVTINNFWKNPLYKKLRED